VADAAIDGRVVSDHSAERQPTYLKNSYQKGELHQEATHKKFLSVRQEGARQVQRNLDFYNLDSQSAPICAIRG